ncbi:hypothetical protein [Deinococcus soli (ex Cha et al. 2016)]|uniref:Uncharacterized protein n=2 Tax=Deinococcus soli (ex Cha et al. 2016) TaxID=1309411 RepID=A0ACC6KGK1_9DEIO|nr:hypothetical protein [Deinococcus soli (ex Cha et al. 2016)]MDR6218124.1 hypothetical protein [Deinococcus soli (ex Cha et al. 2016)]MDR6328864.1 hypothetical protein [Deinococcus soli (ex Cha et al. 2016)]MDR6751648.1 hypothetical protein [Deinococcus soli (ex Cha et al. 2016)]
MTIPPELRTALPAPSAPDAAANAAARLATDLVGALYGRARQAVWMTTPLEELGATPEAHLAAHGPDGWTQILLALHARMEGGTNPNPERREQATQLLNGPPLPIRPR